MENLHALANMSRWIMEEHLLGRHERPAETNPLFYDFQDFWVEAFESCGSFPEFEKFIGNFQDHPGVVTIRQQWYEILKQTPLRPRQSRPVVLPSL